MNTPSTRARGAIPAVVTSDWFGGIDLSPRERDAVERAPAFLDVINGETAVGVSRIQLKLRIGYNHACALLEIAEKAKLIGPADNHGKHVVLPNK